MSGVYKKTGRLERMRECIHPAYEGCHQCIVFCSDNDFMPVTAVAIQSIIENAKSENQYDIIILHSRINPFTEKAVTAMADGIDYISIRFFHVCDFLDNADFFTENRKTITKETYYRLFIPWLLSDEYTSALYLDGDMVLRKDVYPLFGKLRHDKLICVVRDYWGICNCYMPNEPVREYRESIGLHDVDDYIIGGTILFNLPRFRKAHTFEDVLELTKSQTWKQHDQDVINILCKDSIGHLSADWGWMSDYGNNHYLPKALLDEINGVTDPAIVHYGGSRKPWKKPYDSYAIDFWRYADHTPYMECLLDKVASQEHKFYIVNEITNYRIPRYYSESDVHFHYKGVQLGNYSQGLAIFRVVKIQKNKLHLEGMVGFFGTKEDEEVQVFCEINGQLIPVSCQHRENGYVKENHAFKYRGEAFKLDYMLDSQVQSYHIQVVCRMNGMMIRKKGIGFGRFSPLNTRFKRNYYHSDGFCVTKDGGGLYIEQSNAVQLIRKELSFCKELWKTGKKENRKAVFVRQIAHVLKRIPKKPIWLISDRVSKADDNGEVFFKYICKNCKDAVNPYFIIKKDAIDYDRVRTYGKIIEPYSYKHKILRLIAEYSISSQTDNVFRNLFVHYFPYQDLLSEAKFVFLQHGITMTDNSTWLARSSQQFSGFVVSTEKEYRSILDGAYDYSEKEVWLTGMSRYDELEDCREKVITFLPTWRRYLATGQDQTTGFWHLKGGFASSRYATFYRELLSDPRLTKKAEELGYQIQFRIHPSFCGLADAFGFGKNVRIVTEEVSYKEIYKKSALIITDYSSSINDFAYLRKPIMYCQFDDNEFFAGSHVGLKGDMDYERDGFGEVEYDLNSTVDRIIEYMENDCQLKEKYRKRIDSYFKFHDRNHCQRIYERILKDRAEDI